MKYEQPWGVSDPNSSYINGNPSTGTMGSIPPAAAIENPQREIVNLITDAGETPADSDLHQLARGVQSGKLNYAIDTGTVNALAINVSPPLLAYAAGQRWTVKVLNLNTGPSVINISGLGSRHIVYPGGAELKGGELPAGGMVSFVDDGTHLQLANVSSAAGGLLTAPKTYYVNASIGNDTLYDGTSATVSGTHGPFASHLAAIAAAQKWNQNGFDITINTADGIYPPFYANVPPNGAGKIIIVGNVANPANVVIHALSGEAVTLTVDNFSLQGLTLQTDADGTLPHIGVGLRLSGCTCYVRNLNFGNCTTAQIFVASSAALIFNGVDTGDPTAFIHVSGDAPYHMWCDGNSLIYLGNTILTTIGNRTFSAAWAYCLTNAVISTKYQSQSLGGTVTGKKYNAVLNGVINTGTADPTYFPGSVAGTTATGGQYG